MTNVEGDTFVRQMSAMKRYAAANGIEIVRGFEERGVSGKTEWENRPAWVEMIESLNGVRAIVIEKLDRLARDLMVQEHIIADLKKRDITLISTLEPDLGSEEPTRVLIRHIFGAISSYERAMTVAKLKHARERKRIDTGKCEGRKPFGDRPGEKETICLMQKLRASGHSYAAIAQDLNIGPTPSMTRTGKPWHAAVVRDVLIRSASL
jgi:DNA invertase Pin-like site-specific DNA recombinase